MFELIDNIYKKQNALIVKQRQAEMQAQYEKELGPQSLFASIPQSFCPTPGGADYKMQQQI